MPNKLVSRARAFFRRERAELELEEEISAHIELQTRKYIQAGMSGDQARRRARLDFGALESAKEECRDARRVSWFLNVTQDLRYAIRTFRRAPGFTGIIIFLLALGMGANLATFSVTDAILLRMLPVRDPASLFRTVRASGNADDSGGDGGSYILFREMQKRTSEFAELMAYQSADPAAISLGRAEPERLVQQTVSGNYFPVLGVHPVIGRMISPEEDGEPGRHAVAVISYRLWKSRFDENERAIGSKLQFGRSCIRHHRRCSCRILWRRSGEDGRCLDADLHGSRRQSQERPPVLASHHGPIAVLASRSRRRLLRCRQL